MREVWYSRVVIWRAKGKEEEIVLERNTDSFSRRCTVFRLSSTMFIYTHLVYNQSSGGGWLRICLYCVLSISQSDWVVGNQLGTMKTRKKNEDVIQHSCAFGRVFHCVHSCRLCLWVALYFIIILVLHTIELSLDSPFLAGYTPSYSYNSLLSFHLTRPLLLISVWPIQLPLDCTHQSWVATTLRLLLLSFSLPLSLSAPSSPLDNRSCSK